MNTAIKLGSTARRIRENAGLSQRKAAECLLITSVHLCNIEHDRSVPSMNLQARYRTVFGVDLYVAAWLQTGAFYSLPKQMSRQAERLAVAWERHFHSQHKNKGVQPHA